MVQQTRRRTLGLEATAEEESNDTEEGSTHSCRRREGSTLVVVRRRGIDDADEVAFLRTGFKRFVQSIFNSLLGFGIGPGRASRKPWGNEGKDLGMILDDEGQNMSLTDVGGFLDDPPSDIPIAVRNL